MVELLAGVMLMCSGLHVPLAHRVHIHYWAAGLCMTAQQHTRTYTACVYTNTGTHTAEETVGVTDGDEMTQRSVCALYF